MKYPTLFLVAALVLGCADPSDDSDRPAFDTSAPRVHIVAPVRGTFAGNVSHVNVVGTVSDDSGQLASVSVNGVPAAVSYDGMWLAKVPVKPGTNLLRVAAIDRKHNEASETRAVVVGPMATLDRRIANGVRATLSAQALSALGNDTATFIADGGLMTTAQDKNPVVNVGADCVYARMSITNVTVGNADVHLEPTTGGIAVATTLENVSVSMHLQWALACAEDSRDVVMSAQRVTVQGLLTAGVVARKLDVQFDHPTTQVTGFDLRGTDVPDEVLQMLQLDSVMSGILTLSTERLVVPMVKRSLTDLEAAKTVDMAGTQIDVDVEPTQVSFTPDGGTIAFDASLRARGDKGSFVFVPNSAPVLDMKNGFELAIADDAANQLLTSLWSAKGFDMSLDLEAGAHGAISKLYDSVQLHLAMPPHVDAGGSPLQLTLGDWIATFRVGDTDAVTVAIHAKSALYALKGDDGKLRMSVSTPAVDVDVIAGAESITKAQYLTIKAFARERVEAACSAAVAALPMPAVGDPMLVTPWADPRSGYLFVVGDIQ